MEQPRKIVILGTGGNCIDILDTIEDINRASNKPIYECIGFLDDNQETWGKDIQGIKVLGSLSDAQKFEQAYFVNGIGSHSNFWKKDRIIAKSGVSRERFVSIIHPSASISRSALVGLGVVVFQNVVIGSNAKIGDHVFILSNTVINHDTELGDYTIITSGVCVSGGVHIGKLCYLGTNSSVRNDVVIEDYCLVGMGSVVLGNIPERTVVAGNPAKPLRLIQINP